MLFHLGGRGVEELPPRIDQVDPLVGQPLVESCLDAHSLTRASRGLATRICEVLRAPQAAKFHGTTEALPT